jgi:hypothetical protein
MDLTDGLTTYAEGKVAGLASDDLCGFVLKKDSPSCGWQRVKVYDAKHVPDKSGQGIFAAALVQRLPDLPVEEEGRLSDPRLRENFVERVFAYARLRRLFGSRWTSGTLVRFHTAHKLILMAHSIRAYQDLGRLVARVRTVPRKELERDYTSTFMAALAHIATPRRHTNVLQHMARLLQGSARQRIEGRTGFGNRGLSPGARAPDRAGHASTAPRARPQRRVSRRAAYLEPHPKELMLRNHV